MKKLVVGCWLLVVGALAAGVAQAELVEYRDYDASSGTFTNAVRECTLVTSETQTLADGWYAVQGLVSIPEGNNLTVNGTAHLVLCDGATLSVEKPGGYKAAVKTTDATLVIYGQMSGTGALVATGDEWSAGIGGSDDSGRVTRLNGGRVTINGGVVTATGGQYGAGIGGGGKGSGGMVTINGGTVTATGGSWGAGIGGGEVGSGGAVTINGGTVTAMGGCYAAGIGGGNNGADGTVMMVTGGAIHTSGVRQNSVQISGGIFNIPIPDDWCALHFIASGNPDSETRSAYPYAVVPAWTVTTGTHPRTTAVWTSGDGSVSNTLKGSFFRVPYGTENVAVHFTALSDYVLVGESTVNVGAVTEDITFGVGNEYAEPLAYCKHGDIPYLDWNGLQLTNAVLSKYDYALVTEAIEEMETGWYVVAQDVERATIKVTGAVNLVVADGCELKVEGGGSDDLDQARIEVSEGNSLVICGQAGGTGKVTATSLNYGAGIGGGHNDACGSVTINGCAVTATGNLGAGIGGGHGGDGGTIRINGGTVTATTFALDVGDIGSGNGRINAGLVTISGGAVKAESILALVTVSGGIFWKEPEDGWIAPRSIKMENPDETTKEDYPYAVMPVCLVTIGGNLNMSAAWTSGDGSETNAVEGAAFSVPDGTERVKVIFTADDGYEIIGENAVELGTVTQDIVFGAEGGYMVPEVAITDPCLIAFGRSMPNMTVVWTRGDGSVTNVVPGDIKGTYVPRGSENVRIICTANPGYELIGESVFDLGMVTTDITFGIGNDYRFPVALSRADNIVYLDWDEANGRMTNAVARTDRREWKAVDAATRSLRGCMVVTNDVTIPIAQVVGAAVLVLCNDATLTVTGTGDEAAINVPNDASLTITVRKGSTGRVVAQGGADCAGIGSQFKQGSGSVLGAVRIVAGTVTATGGKNGAGIGNGFYGKGGSVKIFGGAVTAVGGYGAASDIGDGGNPYSPCAVSISGGIFARPVQEAWCADHFAVFDNLDPATKSAYPYTVLPASTLTIGKCPIHVSAAWTSGDGLVTNAIEGASVVMRDGTPNVRVIFTADDGYALDHDAVVDLGTVTGDITFGVGNDYKVPHAVPAGAVSYLDWDAEDETLTNATVAAGEWTLVTDETRALNDGWYVVAYDVVLPAESNIVVNGSARLILCDGALLSVTGGDCQAAIEVSRTDAVTNSLTIYGQTEGAGRLMAQGGGQAAAIGTGLSGNFGTVTINGGRVTAKRGYFGKSDIGNGWFDRGGTVVVRGGIFGMTVAEAWCAEHRWVFDNPDPATKADYPYAVLPAWKVTVGGYPRRTAHWTSGDGSVTNAVNGASFMVRAGERDVRVIFTADACLTLVAAPAVWLGTVTKDIVFGVGNDYKVPDVAVPYLAWDEVNHVMTNAVSPTTWIELTAPNDIWWPSDGIKTLEDGKWYVVLERELVFPSMGRLVVNGHAHLILVDGASLTIHEPGEFAPPTSEASAITLEGDGCALTIYGQTSGSGRLDVKGHGRRMAGITGGSVTVNGGKVETRGMSNPDHAGPGVRRCNLTVNGGSLTATGSGQRYGGIVEGTLTVNGGMVTATGGEYAAGIGGCYDGPGSESGIEVTINGGTVVAQGGMGGAGIGGGNGGAGGTVTVTGGAVMAHGGEGAEDIGRGHGTAGSGTVRLYGGIFWAKPKDGWLVAARSAVPNMDADTAGTYPWRVVESEMVVTLDNPMGPFETAETATNKMAAAVFAPSENVTRVLTTGAARGRYAGWFDFDITSKDVNEWYVEAVLSDAAKTRLAETATKATRQIPVAEIAALAEGTKDVPVEGCEPGFYYTLKGSGSLGGLGGSGSLGIYGPELSGLDGKVMFGAVEKPSDAAGFFTIGVSATKGK